MHDILNALYRDESNQHRHAWRLKDELYAGPKRRGVFWEFESPRLGSRICGYTRLLRDFLVLLECDASVARYKPYATAGCGALADAEVMYRDGRRQLLEVTYAGESTGLNTTSNVVSVTEQTIRENDIQLRNAYILVSWGCRLWAPTLLQRCRFLDAVTATPAQPIVALAKRCDTRPENIYPIVIRELILGTVTLPQICVAPISHNTEVLGACNI